jgi:ribosomal protein L7/L12
MLFPDIMNKSVEITISFSEPPREVLKWSQDIKKGDTVLLEELSLKKLTEQVVEYPETTLVYDLRQNRTNKFPCIKVLRALTGWGLKESKDYVEFNMDRVIFIFRVHKDIFERVPNL